MLGFLDRGETGMQGLMLAQKHTPLELEEVCHLSHKTCPSGAGKVLERYLCKENIGNGMSLVGGDGSGGLEAESSKTEFEESKLPKRGALSVGELATY